MLSSTATPRKILGCNMPRSISTNHSMIGILRVISAEQSAFQIDWGIHGYSPDSNPLEKYGTGNFVTGAWSQLDKSTITHGSVKPVNSLRSGLRFKKLHPSRPALVTRLLSRKIFLQPKKLSLDARFSIRGIAFFKRVPDGQADCSRAVLHS